MVNRIFCYSYEEAERNGNVVSFGSITLFVLSIILLFSIAGPICIHNADNPMLFLLLIFAFFFILILYLGKKNANAKAQLTAFATDSNNNVYYVSKINNGEDYFYGGMAAGETLNTFFKDSSHILGESTKLIGGIMSVRALNKSVKIMQNPEIIAQMVECADTTTGAEIIQILKVYNYTQNSHIVKIICDYRILRTGKIKYNKNIKIRKSYNCFNDLMNIILDNNRGY